MLIQAQILSASTQELILAFSQSIARVKPDHPTGDFKQRYRAPPALLHSPAFPSNTSCDIL
jgi:hypothetical protein